MAAWTAGLTVTFGPSPTAAASLVRWEDVAADVPGQPDVLVLPSMVAPGRPALVDATGTSTHADHGEPGVATAEAMGISGSVADC